ncbi:MAG: hypothetical protein DRG11_03850 [Epsilonproteobacteria bacterium]|nr:MAG: hypothetical protein DRG11_03850 [Campylobacterota bacterium]
MRYIFSIILFVSVATSTILQDDNLIDKRAVVKLQEITNELKQKTNTDIYVHLSKDNGLSDELGVENMIKQIKQKEQKIISTTDGSYVVVFLSIKQKYINMISSKDIKDIINKDDIIDNYMVPLLASFDKNELQSKVSASVLNGVAQIADVIAKSKNIKLKSSIGSAGKTAGSIWQMFIYTIVLLGIISYFFIILREKKLKKNKYE